ncbi:peroxiredoxin [Demequina oxidasica]|uniref:peroxiredoxin n=1 Tax=Demequina oxidasica TaxID=676199 RepID=UPI000A5BDB49|nr:peroxiredoxin [Demequina oxidasica]
MTPVQGLTAADLAEARELQVKAQPLVGQPAPAFSLLDQHGRTVTLDGFRGTGVLLVFIPFAFTDTCTNELVDLQGAEDLLTSDEVKVMVISCDSIYTLKAWADAHAYDGGILSDFWPHGEAARAYGVFNEDKGLANRGSFLIDGDGIVRWAIVSPMGQARDLDEYRAALPLAISCPSKA